MVMFQKGRVWSEDLVVIGSVGIVGPAQMSYVPDGVVCTGWCGMYWWSGMY